jgi:hypothetical protein
MNNSGLSIDASTLMKTEQPTARLALLNTKLSLASSLAKEYMSMAVRDRRHRDETEAETTSQNITKRYQKVISNL